MKKLEQRLQTIQRAPLSPREVQHGISQIEQKSTKHSPLFKQYNVVLGLFVVLCFLIFIPQAEKDPTTASPTVPLEHIEEIIYMQNDKPTMNHNVTSFNYIVGRTSVKDSVVIEQFASLFNKMLETGEPISSIKANFQSYEIALRYEDDTTRRLKLINNNDFTYVLQDLETNQFFEIKEEQLKHDFMDLVYKNEKNYRTGLVIIILVVIGIVGLIQNRYEKKYGRLDQYGKPKKLKYPIAVTLNIVFILPIFFMVQLIGTIHLGFIFILFLGHAFVGSLLNIKLGNVRPNKVYSKIILPLYTLLLILFILIIIVV